ncbi:MAG: pyrroline-5-carboxylate reductase [Methylotenera sp.]|nr:pyrroline-5-carboxylate reductase [Oligoflexia bacterium]
MKIGIIGLGKMGEALVSGLKNSGDSKSFVVYATTRSEESAKEASDKLGLAIHTDNRKLTSQADILLLCVKPHQAKAVLEKISPELTSRHLIISICAAVTTQQIVEWSGGKCAAIRAMPNTPCLIGQGMTVFSPGFQVKASQLAVAEKIFGTVGLTAVVEESLMDGVTGLSGCGPAYIYLIIEALSEAGVKVGLPRKVATLLAAQTLMGSAKMVLERGEHPAALKDEVTTPAGCTIDGLMALEDGKLRVTLIKAVLAATKRSKSLRG